MRSWGVKGLIDIKLWILPTWYMCNALFSTKLLYSPVWWNHFSFDSRCARFCPQEVQSKEIPSYRHCFVKSHT